MAIHRLYSDLLKGKLVVINTFFTTCKGSCLVVSATMSGLQSRLGDRLGKQVFLLSFSVDPEADTPATLKTYAERFHSKPGWLFLTGKKENVDLALYKLGQKVQQKEDHLRSLYRQRENRLWKKVFAPSKAVDQLKEIVESVLRDKD